MDKKNVAHWYLSFKKHLYAQMIYLILIIFVILDKINDEMQSVLLNYTINAIK